MPSKLHKERIEFDGGSVYRYLMCCKRCRKWENSKKNVGTCLVTGTRKMGNCLSCDSFSVTADGWGELFLETARIDKEMTKVIIGTDVFYCYDDEIDEIRTILQR